MDDECAAGAISKSRTLETNLHILITAQILSNKIVRYHDHHGTETKRRLTAELLEAY